MISKAGAARNGDRSLGRAPGADPGVLAWRDVDEVTSNGGSLKRKPPEKSLPATTSGGPFGE
jgi:hypothetical protein